MELTLLGEEASQAYIPTLFRLLEMRPTLRRITQCLTILTSLVVHHGDVISQVQLETLCGVVDEWEDRLVRDFRTEDLTTQGHLIMLFNIISSDARAAIAQAEDTALRARYREHGLHGMFQQPELGDDTDCEGGPVCVVCMDCSPDCNVSAECEHEMSICSNCMVHLDSCPICRRCTNN